MKKVKKACIFLVLALALILTVVPAYATGDSDENVAAAAEEVVEPVEDTAAEEDENGGEKSNSVMNIVLIGVVVAVIAIAGTEIHRDNKRKEARK